ncbi:MAG: CaiB/BaiF CoA-transferase family protein [Alphaproteobacteria bacterium]|nr:CaiB/BaiF CoA-transferase family protein [Alphaproteobacteria bacterium]
MPLPLEGLRVVEFAHMVMGPTCGLVLADLGADVIKVEPVPHGDNTRRLTGTGIGFFATFNRNKRSLAVDMKHPDGKAIVEDLVRRADIVSENFRPGAMDALGLGYEALSAINPRMIYCQHKGFLAGPYEERAALDEVVQMMGGLAYMTGPKGRPLRAGASVNDIMGGMFGVIGILAALRERDRTGVGTIIRTALFENTVFLMGPHMAQARMTGRAVDPMPSRLSAWAVYDVFETADDGQVFVGVVTDTQWRTFCDGFGLAALKADPELQSNPQRVAARPRLLPELQALFRTLTKAELLTRLEALGLPFAPITSPMDLFDDPHLAASGGLLDTPLPDGPTVPLPALPLEINGERLGLRAPPPAVGADSDSVLADLGYSPETIQRLTTAGVVKVG